MDRFNSLNSGMMPDLPTSAQQFNMQYIANAEINQRVEGLSLRQLLAIFWSNGLLILISTVLCAGLAAFGAHLVHRRYDASILLAPIREQGTFSGALGSLGGAASQISGLASLAGINLGRSGGATEEAIATLQSEALTERYIEQNNLLPILFSARWNPANHSWKGKAPTLWDGNAYFAASVRKVTEDAKTGLVTMVIRWKDPQLAATWANGLVAMTNDYLRSGAIQESERDIQYLSEQANKATAIDLRHEIYTLMEGEIDKEMMARGSQEFAFKIIDPAEAPQASSYPKPLLWILAGCLAGLALGMLVASVRSPRISPR